MEEDVGSGVNASLTLGDDLPLPFSPPLSPPFPCPPYLTPSPSLPHLPLEVGPLNPARGSGGALLALPSGSGEPQPKSNLVHFSLKIRHLVAKFLMILVKSQLTEKQVVYIVNTIIIYYNRSQFIGSWQHQYLLRCNFTNASA